MREYTAVTKLGTKILTVQAKSRLDAHDLIYATLIDNRDDHTYGKWWSGGMLIKDEITGEIARA